MLPKETVRRNPSRVINEGAKRVVHEPDRTQIRRLLKEGAQERAARDLALAKEWFSVDEQAWQGRRR
jgi:CopG family transcriptional regulator / antitoxin EndoAI